MKCEEAQEFVSRLCDGQVVPREAAEHVGACQECRERLDEYLRIGAEMRRLASLEQQETIRAGAWERARRVRRVEWWRGARTMRIPRFAFVSMLVLILVSSSGFVLAVMGQYPDRRPIIWGSTPNEPLPPKNGFVVVNPVLIRGNQVVCDLSTNGYSGDDGDAEAALMIYYPGQGRYLISSVPFEGAVEGAAKLDQIRFTLNGENYLLMSGMPILRSNQVWVSHDPHYRISDHIQARGISDDHPFFRVRSLKLWLQPGVIRNID